MPLVQTPYSTWDPVVREPMEGKELRSLYAIKPTGMKFSARIDRLFRYLGKRWLNPIKKL